jgi:CRP-like cAMP-binding protein
MPARLIANLQNYGPLAPTDRGALEALVGTPSVIAAGGDLVAEGQATSDCHVLLHGQAFRHRTLPDGRRQILSFNLQGDIVDLQGVLLSLDFGVSALTACHVATVSRSRLDALLDAQPRIARALWRYSLVEGAIFREWMVGMGRRSALARIAHLLCEIYTRMRAVGLATANRCHFPVTQAHLADALGLSGVHTNRVLQTLRASGLIGFRGRELVVLDWDGLCTAGEFDPGYLHLPVNGVRS